MYARPPQRCFLSWLASDHHARTSKIHTFHHSNMLKKIKDLIPYPLSPLSGSGSCSSLLLAVVVRLPCAADADDEQPYLPAGAICPTSRNFSAGTAFEANRDILVHSPQAHRGRPWRRRLLHRQLQRPFFSFRHRLRFCNVRRQNIISELHTSFHQLKFLVELVGAYNLI